MSRDPYFEDSRNQDDPEEINARINSERKKAKEELDKTSELLLSTCKKLSKDGLYDMLPLDTALWYDKNKLNDKHRHDAIKQKIAELEIEKQKLEQQLDD